MKNHRLLAPLCAGGLLALTNAALLFPPAVRAQDAPPQGAAWAQAGSSAAPTVAAGGPPSSTGRCLLLLALGFAGLLVVMERLAGWQLGLRHAGGGEVASALGLPDQGAPAPGGFTVSSGYRVRGGADGSVRPAARGMAARSEAGAGTSTLPWLSPGN